MNTHIILTHESVFISTRKMVKTPYQVQNAKYKMSENVDSIRIYIIIQHKASQTRGIVLIRRAKLAPPPTKSMHLHMYWHKKCFIECLNICSCRKCVTRTYETYFKIFKNDNLSKLFRRQNNSYYQLLLIFTALLYVDLINVAYLTACAFIWTSWRCTVGMTSFMTLNRHKNR